MFLKGSYPSVSSQVFMLMGIVHVKNSQKSVLCVTDVCNLVFDY